MIKRGSLVVIFQYTPREDGIELYGLKFRSLYERGIIWTALNESILGGISFRIIEPGDTKFKQRRKGRKYYNFPRRNRIFMSESQFSHLLYYSYDIMVEISNPDVWQKIFKILESFKFIPGTIRYGVNKSSDLRYRCCFKAINRL